MTKISLDISDKMYGTIKKLAMEKTIQQEKFIGMNDILIPILEKEFGK